MKAAHELFLPFMETDAYTRSLLVEANSGRLSSGEASSLRDQFPMIEDLREILTDSRIGNVSKLRASQLRPDELGAFARSGMELVTSSEDLRSGLADLGFKWGVHQEELVSAEQTSTAAAVLLIAVAFLGRLRPVNYQQLSDRRSVPVDDATVLRESNWWKNRTPEHLWRELAWIEATAEAIIQFPAETTLKRNQEVLRLGHLLSAVTQLSRPLLR